MCPQHFKQALADHSCGIVCVGKIEENTILKLKQICVFKLPLQWAENDVKTI